MFGFGKKKKSEEISIMNSAQTSAEIDFLNYFKFFGAQEMKKFTHGFVEGRNIVIKKKNDFMAIRYLLQDLDQFAHDFHDETAQKHPNKTGMALGILYQITVLKPKFFVEVCGNEEGTKDVSGVIKFLGDSLHIKRERFRKNIYDMSDKGLDEQEKLVLKTMKMYMAT